MAAYTSMKLRRLKPLVSLSTLEGQSIIQRMRMQLTLPADKLICWASPWMGRTLWVRYSRYHHELLFVILSLIRLPEYSSSLLQCKIKQGCLSHCGLTWPVWLYHCWLEAFTEVNGWEVKPVNGRSLNCTTFILTRWFQLQNQADWTAA